MSNEHIQQIANSLRKEGLSKKETLEAVYKSFLPGATFLAHLLVGEDASSKRVRSELLKRTQPESLVAVFVDTAQMRDSRYLSLSLMNKELRGGDNIDTNYLLLEIHNSQGRKEQYFGWGSGVREKGLGKRIAKYLQKEIQSLKLSGGEKRILIAQEIAEAMKPIRLQATIEELLGI